MCNVHDVASAGLVFFSRAHTHWQLVAAEGDLYAIGYDEDDDTKAIWLYRIPISILCMCHLGMVWSGVSVHFPIFFSTVVIYIINIIFHSNCKYVDLIWNDDTVVDDKSVFFCCLLWNFVIWVLSLCMFAFAHIHAISYCSGNGGPHMVNGCHCVPEKNCNGWECMHARFENVFSSWNVENCISTAAKPF